jgi:hypothetical protein
MGLYLFLSFVYFFLLVRIISAGPEPAPQSTALPVEMR